MKTKLLIIATLTLSINAFAQQWTVKTPMPTAITASCAAVINDTIYIIGGSEGTSTLGTVEAYCTNTDTWSTKTPMPTPRGQLGVAAVNGNIYAIGGYNGSSAVSTVEEFNPVTNTWATKTSMPVALSEIYCGTIGNNIYVTAGWPGAVNTLEIYNTVTDTWSNGAAIDTGKLSDNSCAILNGQMYIIGGANNYTTFYNTNESYDTTTNAWTYHAPLPQALAFGAVTVLNNEIHYLGGQDTIGTGANWTIANQAVHYVYNNISNSWTNALPLLHKRTLEIAVTVNGNIYVIGGSDSTGNAVNWNEEYSIPCSQTTFDTVNVTVHDTIYTNIAVTDTLIINAMLTGIAPPNNINTLKIYPNPTKDHIYINTGNYSSMTGYSIKITNAASQTVYQTSITSQLYYIDLNTFGGKGTYFVYLYDANSNIIDVRKIILQ